MRWWWAFIGACIAVVFILVARDELYHARNAARWKGRGPIVVKTRSHVGHGMHGGRYLRARVTMGRRGGSSVVVCVAPVNGMGAYQRGSPCGGRNDYLLRGGEDVLEWSGTMEPRGVEWKVYVENHNLLFDAAVDVVDVELSLHDFPLLFGSTGLFGRFREVAYFYFHAMWKPGVRKMLSTFDVCGRAERGQGCLIYSGFEARNWISSCTTVLAPFLGGVAQQACQNLVHSFSSPTYWPLGALVVANLVGFFGLTTHRAGTHIQEFYNVERMFLSMFAHADLLHLINNIVFLLSVGHEVLTRVSCNAATFAIIYILGGLSASLTSLVWRRAINSRAYSVGASGALSALAAFLWVSGHETFFQVPVAMFLLGHVATDVLRNLLMGFRVDVASHLGGTAAGLSMGALVHIACNNIKEIFI